MMLYIVIMRNLQLILETPQLELQMRNFFNEDKDNQSPVRFAMIISLEDLPVYQNCSTITGVDHDFKSIVPDSHTMRESLEIYGGFSENYAKIRYFDRESVDRSKDIAFGMSPEEALKKVDHHLIDFYPDPIHCDIQDLLGREAET